MLLCGQPTGSVPAGCTVEAGGLLSRGRCTTIRGRWAGGASRMVGSLGICKFKLPSRSGALSVPVARHSHDGSAGGGRGRRDHSRSRTSVDLFVIIGGRGIATTVVQRTSIATTVRRRGRGCLSTQRGVVGAFGRLPLFVVVKVSSRPHQHGRIRD